MTIEQINADRETFLRNIEQNVAEELNKLGLQLLNVNITDITDESGYIDAIGRRAAAEAVNKARVDVAEEERKGGIGEAEARKVQRIAVSEAEAVAQSGEAAADRDRRIAIKKRKPKRLPERRLRTVTAVLPSNRPRRKRLPERRPRTVIAVLPSSRPMPRPSKEKTLSAIEIAKSNAPEGGAGGGSLSSGRGGKAG